MLLSAAMESWQKLSGDLTGSMLRPPAMPFGIGITVLRYRPPATSTLGYGSTTNLSAQSCSGLARKLLPTVMLGADRTGDVAELTRIGLRRGHATQVSRIVAIAVRMLQLNLQDFVC